MSGPVELSGPRILRASRAASIAAPVPRTGAAVGFGPGSVDSPSTSSLSPGSVLLSTGRLRAGPGAILSFNLQLPYTGPAHICGNLQLAPAAVGSPVSVVVQGLTTQACFEDVIEIPTGGVPVNNQYRVENADFLIVEPNSQFFLANASNGNVFFSYLITAGIS